jgi:hypothetical protein
MNQWLDIKSFDEDGFTLCFIGEPPKNTQILYVCFEKITWKEYFIYLLKKIKIIKRDF